MIYPYSLYHSNCDTACMTHCGYIGTSHKEACITYCILPGWPRGGPSVLCRPARAARTRCYKWCRRCRTQAGWTPHTRMHTHIDHSGHHRSPQMCSCHRTHLDGYTDDKGLMAVIICGVFRYFVMILKLGSMLLMCATKLCRLLKSQGVSLIKI